jgi:LmbE family N-acetylglucosaminyl deacetylase
MKLTRMLHFEKIFPEYLTLKKEKCLLLAPHPDDETFGCSGLLLKHPENFQVICITDGKHGGRHDTEEEKNSMRRQEFLEVMESYKINNYSFLEIEDRKLIYNFDKFKKINIEEYDYIFIPGYYDQHKDHKAVTVLLQKLLSEKSHKLEVKIVFFEIWSPLPLVNRVVDITGVINRKKEIISLYSSQNRYVDFLEGIVGLNRYRGMLSNVGYAEGYCEMDLKTFLKL